MSYIFFNPNPLGKRVGDCVIRAISKLTKESWGTIYRKIAQAGYELCDMPSSNNVWAAYLKRLGYRRRVIPDTCPNCYTVRDFCEENPQGEFLLATGSHVVAVINGDYYDANNHNDYSGHSIHDRVIDQLERMMDKAQNDYERQEIRKFIKKARES